MPDLPADLAGFIQGANLITTTPTEQLAALPEAVQAELWALTRTVMDTSRDERENALLALNGVADAFIRAGAREGNPAADLPVIRLLAALAQTIREVDVAGFPRTEEGT